MIVIVAFRFTEQFEFMDDGLGAIHHAGQGDVVVLLHGLARSKESMELLANAISREGYEVLNIQYPSTFDDISTLASKVNHLINNKYTEENVKKIHMVGYSMGGLVIRAVLHQIPRKNIGNVIMIGTPNHGSEVADYFKDWWLFKQLYGVAGQELTTDSATIKALPEGLDAPLTVIAGQSSGETAFGSLLPSPHDGTVSVASTHIKGENMHILVKAMHYSLIHNKEVITYVIQGLKTH